ncbi:MAG: cytochrome c oxidase subunit 4 [Actinomycetota bacterium]|nr:cytochrome c oxidase subunit 4 [Actinomycetota bacterium]
MGRLRDLSVGTKVFGSLGVYFVALGAFYGSFAYEWAGTALLLLSGVASLVVAIWLGQRDEVDSSFNEEVHAEVESAAAHGELPDASPSALLVGIGMVVAIAGLPLGIWVIIPGVVMVLYGVMGMMAESG